MKLARKESTFPEQLDKVVKNLLQKYSVKKQHTFEKIDASNIGFDEELFIQTNIFYLAIKGYICLSKF